MSGPAHHELADGLDDASVVVRRGARKDVGDRGRQTRDRDGFLLLHNARGAGAPGPAAAGSTDEDDQREAIEEGADGSHGGQP